MIQSDDKEIDRFMRFVDKLPNGCWFWTGARSSGGGRSKKKQYGSFRHKGTTVRAHRFASEVLGRQECPPGYHRDHVCCFSLCVNPNHIQVVTAEENQARRLARRK